LGKLCQDAEVPLNGLLGTTQIQVEERSIQMKRNIRFVAMVVMVGAGLLTVGPASKAAGLKCTGADGKTACTEAQAADINRGITAGKRMHKPFAMVQGVRLGPNGTLLCKQTNGAACTDEQLSEIVSVMAGGPIHVMKTTDKASPNL
jgi:hypothetical protein